MNALLFFLPSGTRAYESPSGFYCGQRLCQSLYSIHVSVPFRKLLWALQQRIPGLWFRKFFLKNFSCFYHIGLSWVELGLSIYCSEYSTYDLLIPMELNIWSIPFFFLSKNIAPLRLTIRSAFSFRSTTWSPLVRLVKLGRLLAILQK